MKKIVFLALSAVFSLAAFCQNITDVSQTRFNELIIRDANSKRISSKYLSKGFKLAGFSSTIIVIKTANNQLIVFDEKWNRISSKYLSKGEVVKNVIGNYIIIKTSFSEIIIYDKKFNRISSRYE
jgi:hypothetical protein